MAAIAIAAGSKKKNPKKSKDAGEVINMETTIDHGGFSSADSHKNPAFLEAMATLESLSTDEIQQLHESMHPKGKVSAPLVVLICWLTWLFGGALVYTLINDWPYAQSFYYAANVGYSVGYGALYEYNDLSLAWSLFMIVLGASAIGGAIGFFAEMAIESADVSATKVSELEPNPIEGVKEVVESGAGPLKVLSNKVAAYYAANRVFCNVFGLLFVWVTMGTIYGVHHEGWSVLRSIYFAVSGMSTAGLQAPATVGEGREKHVPNGSSWFCGFFTATGVPIFGLALGQLGGVLVDHYIAKKERDALARLITAEEFNSVANLDAGGEDGMIGFTEFAVLEMIRLGRTNVEQINHIRDEFNKRDGDGSGQISWKEIRQFQVSRAAKSLEVERMLHKYKTMTRAEAIKIVEARPMEELKILSDIKSLKATLAGSRALSRHASSGGAAASKVAGSRALSRHASSGGAAASKLSTLEELETGPSEETKSAPRRPAATPAAKPESSTGSARSSPRKQSSNPGNSTRGKGPVEDL